MNVKTAVVAGASGLVGKKLLHELLESPVYIRVIALVRKKLNMQHDRLYQMEVDFDKLYELRYQILGDDFFCCLGTTIKKAGSQEEFYKVDFTYCYELARVAKANESDRFLLVSAIGADAKSSVFYSKVKGELERAISNLGIPLFQVFRPSFLLGIRVEPRIGEAIGIGLARVVSPLMIGSLTRFRPIEAAKVAKAMLKAAQQDVSKKVKTYTFAEMVN